MYFKSIVFVITISLVMSDESVTIQKPCLKPLIDGQWGLWTTWSSCSVTCGTGGTSSRQRNCDNPRPFGTGKYCIGQSYEIQQCSGPNGPQVIQNARNFTRSAGSQVLIKSCARQFSSTTSPTRQMDCSKNSRPSLAVKYGTISRRIPNNTRIDNRKLWPLLLYINH